MKLKKAIVIGATGMVGAELLKLLIKSKTYTEIISLVRRPGAVKHSKLTEIIIDFNQIETYANLLKGDVLFSTLGTTRADAKGKDAQYKVDFTYQYEIAKAAASNGVGSYVLVSSAGANPKSKNFYMNMKGTLDQAVQSLAFDTINILRPGQLDGNRVNKRFAEKMGLSVMYGLNKIGFFKRYKPIQAGAVAMAMIHAAESAASGIYTLNEVHTLAK